MRDIPILLNGPMVLATMAGRKRMTRRVMLDAPEDAHTWSKCDADGSWIGWCSATRKPIDTQAGYDAFTQKAYPKGGGITCPYGAPGDRLWVRETWAEVPIANADGGQGGRMGFIYRADGDDAFDVMPAEWEFIGPWRPSIHMPRMASRLSLIVESIRVERVQDISEADAWAEGFPDPDGTNREHGDRARYWFRNLWDKLNAGRGYGWDANPWVWVVGYRVEAKG